MLRSRVESAMNGIRKNYKMKKIAYPRVDNSYSREGGYIMYPHPELFGALPLKKKEYQYSKETALLELSNNHFIQPSALNKATRNSITWLIDEIFNQNMDIKKRKLEKITSIVNSFDEFLNGFEMDQEQLLESVEVEKYRRKVLKYEHQNLKQVIEMSKQLNEKTIFQAKENQPVQKIVNNKLLSIKERSL